MVSDEAAFPYDRIRMTIETVVKFFLGLIFLVWLMVWILMPTNLWKNNWWIRVKDQTNSTFFGIQGTMMLIYTFPILFIAVVGCVYLHFEKKRSNQSGRNSKKKNFLHVWRQPVLVKGPLGIVSAIELAFLFMFMALLIWSFSAYLTISFSKITTQSDGPKRWQEKLGSAALRLGLVGNVCFAFLFFPVARGSALLHLMGLTSEASIKYHIWLGHITLTLFTAHALCYIILWASLHTLSEMVKWDKVGVANLAGELALLAGIMMWITTFQRVRRKMFELFFYVHHLYLVFLVLFVLHVGISFFCMDLASVYIFLIDRFMRFLQSRGNIRLVSARVLPCHAMELNFSKSPGLSYSPTSSVFINVPCVSKLQWHPFTVTSNSNMETDKMSVVIKCKGSWSQKLYQMLSSPSQLDRLAVSIEGPYGTISTNFTRYDSLVMISGGSGITPFISIIREMLFRATTLGSQVPTTLLICSFKNSIDLTMLDLLLPITGTSSDFARARLHIEAFVTSEQQQPDDISEKLLLRTIWFKPSPSDCPVAELLGPHSWLWMGAIISASFATFLLLLAILTRYYIYPIDRNSNDIYSYSSRALLNMLFMCASIVIVATGATLWNKKRNAMKDMQIQNMDAPTPTTSPGSWFYNADRELGSLLHQSLVQATKVHFGSRPDLKKMLLQCEGSSIGVLVCGPRSMRHEVAAICSSDAADKLHFESISFSW